MKNLVCICIVSVFFISCSNSDKENIPTGGGDGGGNTGSYWVEYAPVLSYDRHSIWLIVDDTISNTRSGIYRVPTANPVRERLSDIEGATSAVQAGTDIYYLKSSKLHVFNTVTDTTYPYHVTQSMSRITLVNDSTMIGQSVNLIYKINLNAGTLQGIDSGMFPTIYKQDTVAYLNSVGNNSYEILLYSTANLPKSVMAVTDTVVLPAEPTSFSIEPGYGRLAFSIFGSGRYTVYSYEPVSENYTILAVSDYPGVAILDLHTIIFTGEDGRMYRSNMDGSSIIPFWGTAI